MRNEPAFVQKLQKASMDKGRTKFFLSFFLLSFIFWFFTKFSKQYTEVIDFEVSVVNIPASIIPLGEDALQIEATIKATGFQFLYYQFINNGLRANADVATFNNGKAILPLAAEFQKLQDQLLGDTAIVNLFPSTIEFYYQVQQSKMVPIKAPEFDLPMGYAITAIKFDPDSVELIGPADKLAAIKYIVPQYSSNQKIKSKQQFELSLPSFEYPLLVNEENVRMDITVEQYSEMSFQVVIHDLQSPGNNGVRFFPNTAKLTFSAPLGELKTLTSDDFVLGVDLPKQEGEKKKIELRLDRAPKGLRNIRWDPKEVDYLIRQ